MLVVPVAKALARPGVVSGGVTAVLMPMTATTWLLEAQVTKSVMSRVVLSENVPVALNCCVPPTLSVGAFGVAFPGAVTVSAVSAATVATGLTTTKSG